MYGRVIGGILFFFTMLPLMYLPGADRWLVLNENVVLSYGPRTCIAETEEAEEMEV